MNLRDAQACAMVTYGNRVELALTAKRFYKRRRRQSVARNRRGGVIFVVLRGQNGRISGGDSHIV